MKQSSGNQQLIDRVFELLKRRGPLCQSQISAYLLTGTRHVDQALEELKRMGVVEPRPDHDPTLRDIEKPWGLSKPRIRKYTKAS